MISFRDRQRYMRAERDRAAGWGTRDMKGDGSMHDHDYSEIGGQRIAQVRCDNCVHWKHWPYDAAGWGTCKLGYGAAGKPTHEHTMAYAEAPIDGLATLKTRDIYRCPQWTQPDPDE